LSWVGGSVIFTPGNGVIMKQIKKNELYQHLGGFLKAKGIQFTEGAYSKRIQQGCALLTDTINVSQKGLARAKVEADKKLNQIRQAIHEKTAPKSSPTPPPPAAKSKRPAAAKKSRPSKAPASKG
jgi:hypothetical protein